MIPHGHCCEAKSDPYTCITHFTITVANRLQIDWQRTEARFMNFLCDFFEGKKNVGKRMQYTVTKVPPSIGPMDGEIPLIDGIWTCTSVEMNRKREISASPHIRSFQ